MKHSKNKITSKRRKRGRKKSKHVQKNLSVKILPKNLNGSSNWEQLSKVIGYDISKRKSSNSTLPMDFVPSLPQSVPAATSIGLPKIHVSKKVGNSKMSLSVNDNSSAKKILNPHRTAVSVSMHGGVNVFPFKFVVRSSQYGQNTSIPENYASSSNVNSNHQISPGVPSEHHGLTRAVAMDCEMVGTGTNGEDSMLARVSLVNQRGDCLYDSYVKPMEPVTDYRTSVSGIRPQDIKKGKDLPIVQKEVQEILDGRILVGHALKNDLSVLFLSHPKTMIRDTSKYKPFRQLFNGQTPSLKKLTEKILGAQIQTGEHSSVEDAQAAMQIYVTHKKEWENTLKFLKKKKMHYQQQLQQQ